ncbi:MAG TPA: phosphatase PAP2 family protein [Opitutaceae bacterium]|nr:phosphatase PAP2 family protein [Opitutaceae bacterium]
MQHVISRLRPRLKILFSSEGRFLLALLVASACVWGFIALAGIVGAESHLELEEAWMRALRDPADPARPAGPWWLADLARDVSALGGATVVVLLSMLAAVFLLLRGRWRRVLLLVATIGGGYGLSSLLKDLFARERPDVVPHLLEVHSASFPSGHSLSSSVVYLTIGVFLAQAAPRKREKLFFIAAAFALTALIGASRVFLGVHYPTDVLAGWCAGTAWAIACGLVATWLRRWKPRLSSQETK